MRYTRRSLFAIGGSKLFFAGGLALLLSTPLLADRIHLKDGSVLRGKILSIGAGSYIFQETGAKKSQKILKSRTIGVKFSGGLPERGYDGYFGRLLLGISQVEYSELLEFGRDDSTSEAIEASYAGVPGLALIFGHMLIDYTWALQAGLEYESVSQAKPEDLRYSYYKLRAGFSYYFGVFNFQNLYINPYLSLPLGGSVTTGSASELGKTNAALSSGNLSWGLSLMKEWYLGKLIYGAGLSFGRDAFSLSKEPNVKKER